jgi:tRNA threonylcarbamoyladenosine biosynthesis protein TsaB
MNKKVPGILNIETTGENCSVVLSEGNSVINVKERKEGKSHASMLAVFIDEILQEENISIRDLDAVSISKGPGSYTGLRIGVSTAKGLCYGAGIPLISVHTLQALSQYLLEHTSEFNFQLTADTFIVPMIDARRMEVYSAVFDNKNQFVRDVQAEVIDETSYKEILQKRPVVFFGSGAEKCKGMISHENAIFLDHIDVSAINMVTLSNYQFENKRFEDIAYFEPFYLKDFRATTPKKGLI